MKVTILNVYIVKKYYSHCWFFGGVRERDRVKKGVDDDEGMLKMFKLPKRRRRILLLLSLLLRLYYY